MKWFAKWRTERYEKQSRSRMRGSQRPESVERLQRGVEWALAQGLGARDLVPMLERLLAHAPRGSAAWHFGTVRLAEVLVRTAPWRAALLARRALRLEESAQSWGVLALAQTLLGNYRAACRAYRKALALVHDSPEYAHNLGHLLDVALDRPKDAIPYLRAAHKAVPNEPELAASLAHALARAGRIDEARSLLVESDFSPEAAQDWINDWLSASPPGSLPSSPASDR